ncbi:hypothetical protein [Selenomonas sp. AE3005]|uniref:hypothetical protein n=1 Tax=Selenomonas sp. AE3005 TaxID=1485543 RepID=UPI0025E62848|nr:hypothetical protein [Selenomonas sp. AE3005]
MALTQRQKRLNARYTLYCEAEEAILAGQSYTIGNRQYTRASLKAVTEELQRLEEEGCPFDDENKLGSGMSKRVVFYG